MPDIKFSEFQTAADIDPADEVVGLKGGQNTRFPNNLFMGPPGDSTTVDVGTTTTLPEGSDATVTNSGTTQDAVFNFGIPTGADGVDGVDGAAASASAGTTTTGVPGSNAVVVNSGTTQDAVFDFTIPRGDVGATGPEGPEGPEGPQGEQGDAGSGYNLIGSATVDDINALSAGAINTNDAYDMTDSGTVQPTGATQSTAVVADDLIVWALEGYFVNYGPQSGTVGPEGPEGPQGEQGLPGDAATIAAGTTTTTAAGSNANVTNSGTSSAAVFDFDIPRGDQGIQGVQGVPGNDGADGADGATGPEGPTGPQGDQGIQGVQGEQGIQGVQGEPGADGADGADGVGWQEISNDLSPTNTGIVKGLWSDAGVQNLEAKFELVDSLPGTPDNQTIYFVKPQP